VWDRAIGGQPVGRDVLHARGGRSDAAQGKGAIVNTSSINGLVGNGAQPGYTATKHGVIGLTRHGALRWAKAGIRVNAVCPGVIETPMTAPLTANPEIRKVIDGMTPMGRMGRQRKSPPPCCGCVPIRRASSPAIRWWSTAGQPPPDCRAQQKGRAPVKEAAHFAVRFQAGAPVRLRSPTGRSWCHLVV
jgi:NAD(P)-dependent dehydrogenase (short-subunit alcohol dehydrogenase family)